MPQLSLTNPAGTTEQGDQAPLRRRWPGVPPSCGGLPTPAALLPLAGAVLAEVSDEWQDSDRRYLSEGSVALINQPDTNQEVAEPR
jgi:hypothetical protein